MKTPSLVLASILSLSLSLGACGKKAEPTPAPTTAAPAPTTAAPAPTTAAPAPTTAAEADVAAAPEPDVAPAPAPEPDAAPAPVAVFAGLEKLEPRHNGPFSRWLAEQEKAGKSFKIVDTQGVSNAASVLLEEQSGADAECRVTWLVIEVMDKEDGTGVGEVEAKRFGSDCCGATACTRSLEGHHLRFLRGLATKDWAGVAAYVPADGKVPFTLTIPDGTSKKAWTRAEIEAGTAELPSCHSINVSPSCDEAADADGKLTCRCDGGGYHVTYVYKLPTEPTGLATVVEISSQED